MAYKCSIQNMVILEGWLNSGYGYILTLIKPGFFRHLRKPGGGELHPPCFSRTIRPIILKFGMLMARTILMDFPLVPEQNIRNFPEIL